MRIERISRLRDEFIEALRQGRRVEVSDFLAEDLAEDERDVEQVCRDGQPPILGRHLLQRQQPGGQCAMVLERT